MLETTDDGTLRMKLSIEVLSQSCNALLISSSSSFNVIDLSSKSCKISVVEFMCFNLVAVSVNDSFSGSLTHLSQIMDTSVLFLNLLVLVVLTLLSLCSVLFVVTECWGSNMPNLLDNSSTRW